MQYDIETRHVRGLVNPGLIQQRQADTDRKRRKENMKQLIHGGGEIESFDALFATKDPASWRRLIVRRIKRFLRKVYPMEADIAQVEARFGSSVASYFVFFRWIVLIHIFASLPALGLQLDHISYLHGQVSG